MENTQGTSIKPKQISNKLRFPSDIRTHHSSSPSYSPMTINMHEGIEFRENLSRFLLPKPHFFVYICTLRS